MKISFISLFPEMFTSPLENSILEKARKNGLFSYEVINPRDFSENIHRTVDDYPYGGGPGMVMEIGPVSRALQSIDKGQGKPPRTILVTPTGTPLAQSDVKRLSMEDHLIFFCGHYEGIDERVSSLADETISLGDYILTGGELPAMVITDAIVRMIPGVLGHENSAEEESFSSPLLEHPQYTRPPTFEDESVPEILLSGHHLGIEKWRRRKSMVRTMKRRPDLLLEASFTDQDFKLLPMDPDKWGEDE